MKLRTAESAYSDMGEVRLPTMAEYSFDLGSRDRRSLNGVINEAKSLIKQYVRPGADKRFMIFGRGRSGTTLLTNLLDQVPDLTCDGEVLHYRVFSPQSFVDRLARSSRTGTYGFKLLSYQLLSVNRMQNPLALFSQLAAADVKFIHIIRDTFDMTLSHCVAEKTRTFIDRSSQEPGATSLEIDPAEFAHHFQRAEFQLTFEQRIMTHFHRLELDYRTDLADAENHQGTVDAICQYLGVKGAQVTAGTRKVMSSEGGITVTNLEEIRAYQRDHGQSQVN